MVRAFILLAISLCVHRRSKGAPNMSFVAEPVDRDQLRGLSVRLPCRIHNLVGQVQWSHNGIFLGPDREIPYYPRLSMVGEDDDGTGVAIYDLMIRKVEKADEGRYDCQVPFSFLANTDLVSRSAHLTVVDLDNLPPNRVCYQAIQDKHGRSAGLSIDFHETPKFIHYGHSFSSKCLAITGATGQISWALENSTGIFPIDPHDTRFIVTETPRLVRLDGVCRAVTISDLLILPVEGDGQDETLTCALHQRHQGWEVWRGCRDEDGVSCDHSTYSFTCDHRPRVEPVYHDEGHRLHYQRTLTATCSALFLQPGNVTWTVNSSLAVPERLDQDDPRLEYSCEKETTCGNRVISRVSLFIATAEHQTLTLSCESYLLDSNGDKINSQEDAVSITHFEYGPQQPSLTVYYHSFPSGVTLGRALAASCSACVGDRGNISWALLDADNNSFPREFLQDLLQDLDFFQEDDVPFCGSNVTSHIVLRVTQSLHLTRLECSSYEKPYLPGVSISDYSDLLIVDVPIKTDFFKETFPIFIFFILVLLTLLGIRAWLDEDQRRKDDTKVKEMIHNQRVGRQQRWVSGGKGRRQRDQPDRVPRQRELGRQASKLLASRDKEMISGTNFAEMAAAKQGTKLKSQHKSKEKGLMKEKGLRKEKGLMKKKGLRKKKGRRRSKRREAKARQKLLEELAQRLATLRSLRARNAEPGASATQGPLRAKPGGGETGRPSWPAAPPPPRRPSLNWNQRKVSLRRGSSDNRAATRSTQPRAGISWATSGTQLGAALSRIYSGTKFGTAVTRISSDSQADTEITRASTVSPTGPRSTRFASVNLDGLKLTRIVSHTQVGP